MAVSFQGLKSYCGEEDLANRNSQLEHLNIWAIGHLGLNVAIFPPTFQEENLAAIRNFEQWLQAGDARVQDHRITGWKTPGQVSLEGGMRLGGQQPGVRGHALC